MAIVKARLVPLYLVSPEDPDFVGQTRRLSELLADEADLADPRPLGAVLPEADAVVFPQMVGEAYHRVAEFRRLDVPVLVLTSEFGTMAMWDWEIISYLRAEGVAVMAPYSLGAAKTACRALAARRQLRDGEFLVYQDHPGEGGSQPSIFKRFYWWEEECSQRIRDRFGVRIVKRSFEELGARAKAIPDSEAAKEWVRLRDEVPLAGVSDQATLSAVKLYREMIWGCEADTVSMLTKFIVHRSLAAPVVMTNLYPFLMGQAALHHERIPASYRTLITQGWVHYFDLTWGREHQKAAPLSFGTVKSRLWQVLDAGHYDVKLSRDEMHRVKCWIDLNCPLWPDYRFRGERPL